MRDASDREDGGVGESPAHSDPMRPAGQKGREPTVRWGEGALVAVALLLVALLSFGLRLYRQPRALRVPPAHAADGPALLRAERIDVNAASAEELEELPGIGEALAQAIVRYREEHGSFASVEQLDDVPGIGPARLQAIRPHIRLE